MDKIKNVAQRLGIITVEDMERYTALELIMLIANKMNEFQTIINDYSDELQNLNDKIQYLLNEGTVAEVEQIFNEWLQDGTFDTLINQSALKKVNAQLTETKRELTNEVSKILANVTNGNESVTNSEVVNARSYELSLGARLDEIENGNRINNIYKKTKVNVYDKLDFAQNSAAMSQGYRCLFPEKYAVPANTFIESISFKSSNTRSLKLEFFEYEAQTFTKIYEQEYTPIVGLNIVPIKKEFDKMVSLAVTSDNWIDIGYSNTEGVQVYYINSNSATTYTLAELSSKWLAIYPNLSIKCYKRENIMGSNTNMPKNIATVGKSNCDYTEISEALDNINDSQDNPITLLIYPGVYSKVSMKSKKRYVSLIGFDKKNTIIKTSTGLYADAPAELWMDGIIKNITFIADDAHLDDANHTSEKGAYALHIDYGQSDLLIEDCNLISYNAPAVGQGLFPNDNVKFKNCEIISYSHGRFSNHNQGAFYCHGNANKNTLNQNLTLDNCRFYTSESDKVMLLQNIAWNSKINLTSINSHYYSVVSKGNKDIVDEASNNKMSQCGVVIEGNNYNDVISELSYGNNVNMLNKF